MFAGAGARVEGIRAESRRLPRWLRRAARRCTALGLCITWGGCGAYDPELLGMGPEAQAADAGGSLQRPCPLCRLMGAGTGGAPADRGDASLDAAGVAANSSGPTRVAEDAASTGCPSGMDCCPNDPGKTEPGACGCDIADTDSDRDGTMDCVDAAAYGWQRRLTLDGAQIAGSFTNFPVLIRVMDAHLQAEADPRGSDIHFFSAEDQTSPLNYEIESYNSATGALVAWVLVPNLMAGKDTVLYLGYGDGNAYRSGVAAVWNGYKHVWHMAQDPGEGGEGDIKDSTGRSHGTPQGGMTSANLVPAVAGNGIEFDGNDDQIAFTNDFLGSGASTIGAWVNQFEDKSGLGGAIIVFGNQVANAARLLLTLDRSTGGSRIGFYGNDLATKQVPTDTWVHLVWTWDGATTKVYLDGERIAGPVYHTGASTMGSAGRIGNSTFNGSYFLLGQLDEIRVSTVSHSKEWVSTEYNSQRPGSTFIKSIDPEQPASGTLK